MMKLAFDGRWVELRNQNNELIIRLCCSRSGYEQHCDDLSKRFRKYLIIHSSHP